LLRVKRCLPRLVDEWLTRTTGSLLLLAFILVDLLNLFLVNQTGLQKLFLQRNHLDTL